LRGYIGHERDEIVTASCHTFGGKDLSPPPFGRRNSAVAIPPPPLHLSKNRDDFSGLGRTLADKKRGGKRLKPSEL
jgi:hypothetical protein